MQSHGEDLRLLTGDDSLARQVMADYRTANLEPDLRALLDYCVKLTLNLGSTGRADVDVLRDSHGWTDEAIHDAVQVTGFFNYYTRLAEGLGVEPEDFMQPR